MTAKIQSLIDKQDTFEIVRDKIAQILADETASQQAKATAASKDSSLWKLRIYLERSNPWEQFLNSPSDLSPLVNINYDNSTFDPHASDRVKTQRADGIYNIDCYGYAEAADDGNGGHIPGDKAASLVVHRAIKLVRNILMASSYTYLDLRGTVGGRWPDSITVFQPTSQDQVIQNVIAARIALRVQFNETSPQFEAEGTINRVFVTIKRTEDDEILAEADYDNS